tara:strand:- start:3993 stop:4280 length:288 start_codon:yes stop_codon:yes gene_type:complete
MKSSILWYGQIENIKKQINNNNEKKSKDIEEVKGIKDIEEVKGIKDIEEVKGIKDIGCKVKGNMSDTFFQKVYNYMTDPDRGISSDELPFIFSGE